MSADRTTAPIRPGERPVMWRYLPLLVWGTVLALTTGAVTHATAAVEDWTPEVFDYDGPAHLVIRELTQPPERRVPDTHQFGLVFKNLRGQDVPVLITLPERGKGPFPAIILLHALGSDRYQITRDLAGPLTRKGFACLALDLPCHGDRASSSPAGKPEGLLPSERPAEAYRNIVHAVMDIRQTIDLVETRRDLQGTHGVGVVGYSMGAWLGALTGAADRRAIMLGLLCGAASGDAGDGHEVPATPRSDVKGDLTLLDRYPTIRPTIAAPHFKRPLLMQNGKRDPFIDEEQARDLFRAASAPKELRWYDCGHILPTKAADDLADWLARQFDLASSPPPASQRH